MTQREKMTAGSARLLIGAKLESSRPSADQVACPHLFDMLDEGRNDRITLISAPAGYSETTLIAQWFDSDSSLPAAWLSLDRLDNNLQRSLVM